MRRALATVLTLGLLSGFVLVVVLGLMVAFGAVNLVVAVAAVVLFNAVMLLIGPYLNDFLYRWLYGLEWIGMDGLREKSEASADVVEDVTDEYGYDAPKIGYIDDRNPNAFTYGSARFNARVVLTEGCFEFLDDEETASVVAHELGHITSRDFIIMTLANTLIQILYLVAVNAWRIASVSAPTGGGGGGVGGGGRSGGANRAAMLLFGVAVLSYVLWFFGEYIVLYLSRVREYAADAFAARHTHPDALSMALVKIAYGIAVTEDSTELAAATRNIGVMDVTESKDEGLAYYNVREFGGDRDLLLKSFLFDLHNPWAKLLELKSTHPLTGKRVEQLSRLPGASQFDFAEIRSRFEVDRGRLRRNFLRDVGYLALPTVAAVAFPLAYLGLVLFEALAFSIFTLVGGWILLVGVATLVRARYRYPRDDPEATTVIELLGDVYASPFRGRLARLEGELIGRGNAGYRFSEDLMFKDDTGLMYLKYESWLPLLGNFLFSIRRVPELIGEEVSVDGWFLRGTSPWTGLFRLRHGDETVKSFVHIGGLVAGGFLVVIGLIVFGVQFLL